MRNIPVFCTDYGVASLVLKNIPYTNEAYIHLRDVKDNELFLKECCDFCIAAGAEHVYATGVDFLQSYPHFTSVVKMQCGRDSIGDSDAMLFPVQEETAEAWREIYNQRMLNVPNASYMTSYDIKDRMNAGGLYFVHKDGALLGIGSVSSCNIDVVVSVVAGAGETVLRTLCGVVTDSVITLTVASNNVPAVALYELLGFIVVEEIERWYKII